MMTAPPRPNIPRMGWVSYWNLWPLRCELNRVLGERGVDLLEGTPNWINTCLESGEVSLASSSSICLVSRPDMEMALPLGVASNGPVMSVYLGFRKEHQGLLDALRVRRQQLKELFQRARSQNQQNVRTVAKQVVQESQQWPPLPLSLVPGLRLPSSSATSSALAKILFNLWFGPEAYQLMVGRDVAQVVYTRPPVELWIGDEALQHRKSFHTILDLGSLWKEMTGLPFVFAVWQSRGQCLNGWRRQMLDLGKVAQHRMRVEPAVYLPEVMPCDAQGKPLPLAEYWRSLYYELGPADLKGLLLFLCLARSLKLVPLFDEVVSKLLRWEGLSARERLPGV